MDLISIVAAIIVSFTFLSSTHPYAQKKVIRKLQIAIKHFKRILF